MSPRNQRRLVGVMFCSLIAFAISVWPTLYVCVQMHQSGQVQTVRENRLTGRIATFKPETEHWDYHQQSKQEHVSSNANDIGLRTAFAVVERDHHVERAFLDTLQLNKACLLADAIVHSDSDQMRRFTREDFRLAERCMGYITGALDTLPGKVEIIGGRRYVFAFRAQNLLVGNAVDSFNRYVQAHPESVNWSGAETLAIALVNDSIASWLDFSVQEPTTIPTKTANKQTCP
jgi:hypothetical protein